MAVLQDKLVCGVCKGEKVKLNEATGKNDLCPKCGGRGYLPTEEELKEAAGNKSRRVLHG